MSRLLARIMLAIFMIPAAAIVFVILVFITEQSGRNFGAYYPQRFAYMMLISSGGTWAFVAVYWFLLWRKSVQWNANRIGYTIAAAAVIALLPFFAFVSLLNNRSNEEFFLVIFSAASPLIWLITTVFIWRESPGERKSRVESRRTGAMVCPTCGYNLTGLTSTRCPECGSQFTIDELTLMQPMRAAEEIESQ